MVFIQFPDCKGSLYIEVIIPASQLSVTNSPRAEGELITLAWDAAPEQTPPIEGYRLKVGDEPSVYGESIDVGNVTEADYILPYDTTKFFAVVSYYTGVNSDNQPEVIESVPSNEVSATAKPQPEQPATPEGESNAQLTVQVLTLEPLSINDTKLLFTTLHDLYYPSETSAAATASTLPPSDTRKFRLNLQSLQKRGGD